MRLRLKTNGTYTTHNSPRVMICVCVCVCVDEAYFTFDRLCQNFYESAPTRVTHRRRGIIKLRGVQLAWLEKAGQDR